MVATWPQGCRQYQVGPLAVAEANEPFRYARICGCVAHWHPPLFYSYRPPASTHRAQPHLWRMPLCRPIQALLPPMIPGRNSARHQEACTDDIGMTSPLGWKGSFPWCMRCSTHEQESSLQSSPDTARMYRVGKESSGLELVS